MVNPKAQHRRSSRSWCVHCFYILLFFICIFWNIFNAHRYEILFQRQRFIEKYLNEIDPSVSISLEQLSSDQSWWTKIVRFIPQFNTKTSQVRKIS